MGAAPIGLEKSPAVNFKWQSWSKADLLCQPLRRSLRGTSYLIYAITAVVVLLCVLPLALPGIHEKLMHAKGPLLRFERWLLAMMVVGLVIVLPNCGESDHSDLNVNQNGEVMEPQLSPPTEGNSVSTDALTQIRNFIETNNIDHTSQQWRLGLPKPTPVSFDEGQNYYWVMETNIGPIRIKLMHDVAPMHVTSTIYLTELGFYDGLSFHRVISGFMAQGGCPLGTGTGGPGYKYDGEFDSSVRHDRAGLLSMANAGPGTDGSQFFLTFVPTDWLDDKHSIFGEVVSGMDTVKELEKYGSRDGTTSKPLKIDKATIVVE